MKHALKNFCFFLGLLWFTGCSLSSSGNANQNSDDPLGSTSTVSQAVISVVIHIENEQQPNITNLINAIDMLGQAGIPSSLGADYTWVQQNQTNATELFNDVIKWGGQLDIHTHKTNIYNRADLANLIQSMGFSTTNVVSGYTPDEEESLSSVIEPIQGGNLWQAQYLWGLATEGHTTDDNSWGITRDSQGGPPMIGGGARSIASAENMVEQVSAETYPGYLLTCSIMFNPLTLTVLGENGGDTADDIKALKSRTDLLGAQWLTLEATGELADSQYPEQNSRVEGVSD